jgi:8-oxo-dGTP diphosphatase
LVGNALETGLRTGDGKEFVMRSDPTTTQVSAGGVAFRRKAQTVEVALILVGPNARWQLPKGAVNQDECNEDAAQREVREETGLQTELIAPLDTIEYWFYATRGTRRVRFHKYVHFFLMRYREGNVEDHDHEVEEARWVEIGQALEMLAFASEKEILRKAHAQILASAAKSEDDPAASHA